ncbi:MAG TPA: TetR/AcrR family transcriptional regulator [Phenylobacterium sp.]|jgi:AcrR family transcriptional regulator
MKPDAAPRERILQHAIELFATLGFEATTMRRLGEAVGLDNSSLYRHFRSKAALADAVLDHVAAELVARVADRIQPSRPVTLQALEDVCATAGLYFFDQPAAARLMVHWLMSTGVDGPGLAVSIPATDVSRPGGALVAMLSAWLGAGVRGGVLRQHAMPEAVVILLGATLIRPATRGYLLASLEPKRTPAAARAAWEGELRATVRGAFAP